jgi:hypothetical protein
MLHSASVNVLPRAASAAASEAAPLVATRPGECRSRRLVPSIVQLSA